MKKLLGLVALAGLLFIAAPAPQAEASVAAPGIATSVQGGGDSLATEVRWRRHHGYRRHYGFRRHYGYRRHYGWRRHYWHRRWW
jgi:hypothetical protein